MRILRISAALCVFAFIGVQFLDIYHRLPGSYYAVNPTSTQFAPSLIRMLAGGGVAVGTAFIAFCICAALFGRVYCSFACPFGVLMDILRCAASVPTRLKTTRNTRVGKFCSRNFSKLRYRSSADLTRLVFTVVAAATVIFGYTALFGFIDPYSLYGKIMGFLVHPAVSEGFNAVSETAYTHGIYLASPVNGDPSVPLAAFAFALLALFAVSALSAFRGRFYCNTACPVGGLLGLLSKISPFKMDLDNEKCVSCGICERNCRTECINSAAKTLDFSRCVLCFDCAAKCPRGAVKYGIGKNAARLLGIGAKSRNTLRSKPRSKPSNGKIMARRTFPAAFSALAVFLYAAAKKKEKTGKADELTDDIDAKCGKPVPYGIHGEREDKRLALPPGAGSLDNYLEHCTGCQICAAACKAQILKPSLGEWGLAGLMQPYMDFSAGFCLHSCNDCGKVCPTGAIRFTEGKSKRTVKIGTAVFRKEICVVRTDGTDCAACAEHCPVQAIEMLPYGKIENSLYIPHVHVEVCIGCGACENICPVRPHKAIVVRGLAKQTRSREFNESMRVWKGGVAPSATTPEAVKDFPF